MVSGALDQIRNGVHAGWSLHSLLRRTQLGGSSQSLMPGMEPSSWTWNLTDCSSIWATLNPINVRR